jgi:VanZ family protein
MTRSLASFRFLFRLSAILTAIAILVLSLQPATGVATMPHADKLQHLLAYGGLAGLMALGWPSVRLWTLIWIAAGFGLSVEAAQGLSGLGRTASALDALANFSGACLAASLIYLWRRRSA